MWSIVTREEVHDLVSAEWRGHTGHDQDPNHRCRGQNATHCGPGDPVSLGDGTTTTAGNLTRAQRGGCWPWPVAKNRPRCSTWTRVAAGTCPMAILRSARQRSGNMAHAGLANLIRFGTVIWPPCCCSLWWPVRPMTMCFGTGIVTIRCCRFENGGPLCPGTAHAGCATHAAPPET